MWVSRLALATVLVAATTLGQPPQGPGGGGPGGGGNGGNKPCQLSDVFKLDEATGKHDFTKAHIKGCIAVVVMSVDTPCGDAGVVSVIEAITEAGDASAVTGLGFANNGITDYGAISLAKLLLSDTKILKVDLDGNEIGDSGATALGHVLRINQVIGGLSLNKNLIGDEGAAAIAAGMEENKVLTVLYLVRNRLTEASGPAFRDLLLKNPSGLEMLHLAENRLGNAGACALAEGVKVATSLATIDIDDNDVGDDGVICLANAIKVNKGLTWLDVNSNSFGVAGLEALADALPAAPAMQSLGLGGVKSGGDEDALAALLNIITKSSISALSISSNKIGDEDIELLEEALGAGSDLAELDLSSNEISDAGAEAIQAILETNTKMMAISLTDNQIGDDGAEFLILGITASSGPIQWIELDGNQMSQEMQKKVESVLQAKHDGPGAGGGGGPGAHTEL